jgi:Ni/Fe-hydrogenase subunit HybB-like protein
MDTSISQTERSEAMAASGVVTGRWPSGSGEYDPLYKPIGRAGRSFSLIVSVLAGFVLLGIAAYVYQWRNGLGVTGLSRQIFWGVYITNFVFFIGISHAGALIAAILRISKAEWRRPITRAAELTTVLALSLGVLNVIFDMGRPDRLFNLIRYPQPQSPLVWDIIAVTIYFTASCSYLYLALIPDIAFLRDHGTKPKWLYQILSVGWNGTERQLRVFKKASFFMAILVVPIAVTVHTVISFIFAMTIQPMWHSAILAPYFVTGAIFSGIAAIILAMAVVRKAYRLENYVKPAHFNNLGILLMVMALLWLYFTIAENLTAFYGREPADMTIFWNKLAGAYAPHHWAMFVLCFIIPFPILCLRKTRTVLGTSVASVSVLIGMWLERYTIIVPTLTSQRLALGQPVYFPTWVEWSILAACISFFILLFMVFTKIFPVISISEIREGEHEALADFRERLETYFPGKPVKS